MNDLSQNVNPKHNPVTSILGAVFITISAAMYVMKYILPAFIVFKEDLPYEWYTPLFPLGLGLILTFMNDDYFAQLFSLGKKVVQKKTGTDEPS